MILWEQLIAMQQVNIESVDKNTLAEVQGLQLDNSLSREERIRLVVERTKNPYCFRYGDLAVKVEFSETGPPLEDLLTEFLIRKKSGL